MTTSEPTDYKSVLTDVERHGLYFLLWRMEHGRCLEYAEICAHRFWRWTAPPPPAPIVEIAEKTAKAMMTPETNPDVFG